jgi:hypothetical protein
MSNNDKYDDDYGIVGDAREECSSGRSQSKSWHVRACQGPKDWRTNIYDRETLYGPVNFNGKARPLENRRYKSKWRKKKDKRVFKNITKGLYGYKKVSVEKKWIKSGHGDQSVWWGHPVHKYAVYQTEEPKPIMVEKWESTSEIGLKSKIGSFEYDYVPPPEPVKKIIKM